MAEISKVILPDGNIYYIKDATSRELIKNTEVLVNDLTTRTSVLENTNPQVVIVDINDSIDDGYLETARKVVVVDEDKPYAILLTTQNEQSNKGCLFQIGGEWRVTIKDIDTQENNTWGKFLQTANNDEYSAPIGTGNGATSISICTNIDNDPFIDNIEPKHVVCTVENRLGTDVTSKVTSWNIQRGDYDSDGNWTQTDADKVWGQRTKVTGFKGTIDLYWSDDVSVNDIDLTKDTTKFKITAIVNSEEITTTINI